jgi:hypothetical protein
MERVKREKKKKNPYITTGSNCFIKYTSLSFLLSFFVPFIQMVEPASKKAKISFMSKKELQGLHSRDLLDLKCQVMKQLQEINEVKEEDEMVDLLIDELQSYMDENSTGHYILLKQIVDQLKRVEMSTTKLKFTFSPPKSKNKAPSKDLYLQFLIDEDSFEIDFGYSGAKIIINLMDWCQSFMNKKLEKQNKTRIWEEIDVLMSKYFVICKQMSNKKDLAAKWQSFYNAFRNFNK